MLSPSEEARLRDQMCITLLEATSPTAALARARSAERCGEPAYDPAPDPYLIRDGRIQPRDVLIACGNPACSAVFASAAANARFCSDRCRIRYHNPFAYARRKAAS